MFRALPAGLLAILMALSPGSAAHGNDDIRDLPFVLDAVNDALETARTNVQIPWENPATGNSGVIVVEKTFYPSPETPCRQYRRTFTQTGGDEMMTRGTGCRVGPERWKIEEERTATRVPKATGSGTTLGARGAPEPSPVGTASAPPRTPVKPRPSTTAERPSKPSAKSSTAASAEPKAPAPPALPKFTMPSKAEI